MIRLWRGRGGRRERSADARRISPAVRRADRFGFTDLLTEATTDIGSRPVRLVLTVAGTVLGIGALVATVGLAQTAAGQIGQQFDATAATHLAVTPAEAEDRDGVVTIGTLPWDAADRLVTLAGVRSAAALGELNDSGSVITAVPVNDPSAPAAAPPPLVAGSPELIATLRGRIVSGRAFDTGHDQRADRVAMLGARAAEQLGIERVDTQPSIFIDGITYAVIGIFADVDYRGELLQSVVIPMGTAREDFSLSSPQEAFAEVQVGAGPQLEEQAPLVLAPAAPDTMEVSAPQGSSTLRENIQSDLNLVFVVLSIVVLLAGGLGIANVTTLSVMERIGEVGLRRALGATRRQIAGQFFLESVIIGLLGGLIGAAAGVLGTIAVSVAQGWVPILDPLVALGGVVVGALVGFVAGSIPARRASRIEPIAALRASHT